MARTQQTTIFSSEAILNDVRHKVGIALGALIPALDRNRETPERVNKARDAIEAWIKELKAAKP